LGIKSYRASIRRFGFIGLKWLKTEGYKVIPTWKNAKQKNAFDYMEDRSVQVSNDDTDGSLAKAFEEAMCLSPINPMNTRPE
jgi:hypothetical protein